jgi:hypothetical protein
MLNNIAVLTQSHKAIAAKQRSKKDQIKEISFDEDARRYRLHLTPVKFGDAMKRQGVLDRLPQAQGCQA